jgi:hypothetical protein
MNSSSLIHFRQYAALFFKLLLPLNVLRWIFAVTAVIWGVALWLRASDWGFLLSIAAAITGLMTFLLLTLIPNQVIALVSSRPVSLLGNSRHTLLVFLFLVSTIISMVLYWSLTFSENLQAIPSLIFVVLVMVSLLLQISVLIGSLWPNAQFLVFMLSWVWLQIATWLTTQNPLLLVLAWCLGWLCFSRWWLQWQPKKYQPNFMVAAINDAQQAAAARNAGFLFQSGDADTWLGSRFFGVPDGWRSRSKRLFISGFILLLTPIPLYRFMGEFQFEALIRYVLIPFVMFMSVSIAQGMVGNFIRNLQAVWLHYPGGRSAILSVAWKLYVREVGFSILLIFGLGLVIELVWMGVRELEIWAYSLLTTVLINTASFYLAWWVYLRSQGSLFWWNFTGSVAVMILIALFVATGLLFPLPFDWKGISIVWILLAQLILIALLYKSVRSGFSRMNFVRVA